MKRRVLRAKANKRAMRIISSALSLRPRDQIPVIVDSSFARTLFDAKGADRVDDLIPLITDCVGSPHVRLFYTRATLNALEKLQVAQQQQQQQQQQQEQPQQRQQGGKKKSVAAAKLARQAQCIDADTHETKREARSIFDAAKLLLGESPPTATAATTAATAVSPVSPAPPITSRHVFVATQNHDTRAELRKVFPPKAHSDAEAVAACSIIRATLVPTAVWIDFLHDLNSGAPRKSAAAAATKVVPVVGPAIGSADAAFMRSLNIKVPTSQLAPALQLKAQMPPKPAPVKTADLPQPAQPAPAAAAAAAQPPRPPPRRPRKVGGANPLANKKKQEKLRIIVTGAKHGRSDAPAARGGADVLDAKRKRQ